MIVAVKSVLQTDQALLTPRIEEAEMPRGQKIARPPHRKDQGLIQAHLMWITMAVGKE